MNAPIAAARWELTQEWLDRFTHKRMHVRLILRRDALADFAGVEMIGTVPDLAGEHKTPVDVTFGCIMPPDATLTEELAAQTIRTMFHKFMEHESDHALLFDGEARFDAHVDDN